MMYTAELGEIIYVLRLLLAVEFTTRRIKDCNAQRFGASHSSIFVPSGSTTDANFPYGVDSRS